MWLYAHLNNVQRTRTITHAPILSLPCGRWELKGERKGDSNCLDCQGLNSSSMAHPRKNIARNWSRIPDLCRIQALLCPSESRLRHLPPGGTVFEHRIQDDEQLAHARRERHLFGFPGGTQALIERTNDEIEAGGHECGHVEHGTDLRTAAPDRAFPPPRPTVPIQRRHPHQGADLFTGQGAELRQIRQQRRGQHRPHAGGTTQQVVFFRATRDSHEWCASVRVQPGDVRVQALAHGRALPNRFFSATSGSAYLARGAAPAGSLRRSAPGSGHPAHPFSPAARWPSQRRAPVGDSPRRPASRPPPTPS